MPIAETLQRRSAQRRRVYKGAKIGFWGLHATIDCVVRDLSDSGARLSVESSVGVPEKFELVLEGAAPRACRLVWRKATHIGVAFTD